METASVGMLGDTPELNEKAEWVLRGLGKFPSLVRNFRSVHYSEVDNFTHPQHGVGWGGWGWAWGGRPRTSEKS